MTPEGDPPPTDAQRRAVMRAYRRGLKEACRPDEFFICPMSVGAAAQSALLGALHRGGWITGTGSPVLTDKAKAWASVKLNNDQQQGK